MDAACIAKCIISTVSGEVSTMMDSCNDPEDSAKGKGFCYYDKLQQCTTAKKWKKKKCSNDDDAKNVGNQCETDLDCDSTNGVYCDDGGQCSLDYCVPTISCDALHQQIVQDISTGVEDCIKEECG